MTVQAIACCALVADTYMSYLMKLSGHPLIKSSGRSYIVGLPLTIGNVTNERTSMYTDDLPKQQTIGDVSQCGPEKENH